MSDFRTQFVSGTIPTTSGSVSVPVTALSNFDRGALFPACSLQSSAGIGRTTGSLSTSLAQITANVGLDDVDSVTFAEGYISIARNNLCGTQLLEYIGPSVGPNAMVSRGDFTITLASGVTTADSTAVQGIVNFNKCVPLGTAYGNYNSIEYRAHFCKIDLVNTGTSVVVRATRALGSATLVVRVRVVEFTGANWAVQRVAHTFAASNTNEDATISSAATANSFVVSTFMPTGTTPQQQNYFVWLSSSTNLRHRIKVKPSTAPSCVSYVITNPLLAVTRYGTPDGVNDVTASGVSPESQTLTISAIPDVNQALVLGYAGADTSDTTLGVMCAWWMFDLQNTTTVRMRRSQSAGDTEYVVQVVDFSGVVSARIDTVDPIVDGSSFTITGLFGGSPTVTHGGDAVTVTASSSTSITCTASLGTKKYGLAYDLVVVDATGGTDTTQAPISPAAGTRYVDLDTTLVAAGQRITTTPLDLSGAEQVRWKGSDVTGVGMTEADVEMLRSGLMRWHPAVTGAKFSANDGTGYGTAGLQTFTAFVVPPTLVGTIPDFALFINTPVQINVAQYGSGYNSLSITGTLATGLTNTNGVITGTVVAPVSGSFTVTYTNSAGSVVSNSFVIGFTDPTPLPTTTGTQANVSYMRGSGAQTIDVTPLFLGATSYSISPAVPSGWTFTAGILSIDTTNAITAGPFVVTGANSAGSVQLNPFTVTVNAPATVTVPNLIGLTVSAATAALTALRLAVGAQTSANDAQLLGLIYAQNPAAGTSVDEGTGVDISISLGPSPFPQTALRSRRKTTLRKFLLG